MPKRKVNATASAEELMGSLDGPLPGGPTCYVDGQLMGEGSAENLPGGFIMVA
jgi:hypothetical protein